MDKSKGFTEGYYARRYREVAERVATATRKGNDAYIHVDVPGLEGILAFTTGGLTAIVGSLGVGKTILCDNIVARADVPTVYLPLQSTSLESAHNRLCAAEAGLDYWKAVVSRRDIADRIALAEASERLMDRRKVLVCFDDVMTSTLNDILIDVIGESKENPGTIDEAEECLVVIDNIDMLAADGSPLWQRIQFLKDVVKTKNTALVVVVPGDPDSPLLDLANADEIYCIRRAHIALPEPLVFEKPTHEEAQEKARRLNISHLKTSRYDGHRFGVEFEIDMPTRTVRGFVE